MKNVSLVLALALAAVACSSAATTPASTEEATGTEPESDTGSTTDTKTPAKTTPTEPKKTTSEPETDADPRKACLESCATENTEGAGQFGDIVQPCACDASVCGDVCGDSCGSDKEGKDLVASATEACRACVIGSLKPGGKCNSKVMAECPKQTSCLPFALCVQGCAQ